MKKYLCYATVVALAAMLVTPMAVQAGSYNYSTGVTTEVVPPEGVTPIPPASPFAGFYVGLQVKRTFAPEDNYVYNTNYESREIYSADLSGVGYGAYAGYAFTLGAQDRTFAAIEANYQGFNLDDSFNCHRNCAICGSGLDSIASLRLRLGRIVGENAKTLLYVHGGIASAQVHGSAQWTNTVNPETIYGSVGGFTYGVGIEQAISNRMSLRVEYTVNDLETFEFTQIWRNHTADFSNSEIAVGLTYSF